MDYSITVKHLDVVDSTNRYLRDEADNLWVNGKDIVAVTATISLPSTHKLSASSRR